MQSVTIGANQAGQRLDKFLHKHLPQAGGGFLYKMLRKKNITLNGKKAQGPEILAQGDIVCFFFSEETYAAFRGRNGENGEADFSEGLFREYRLAYRRLEGIRVVYEDAHVVFLDKPAGVLAQKAENGSLSLNEWLIGYLLEKEPGFGRELTEFRPSVCNRLDRNTSGLVLCGRSLPGLQYLSGCIRERKVRKFYLAICAGRLEEAALVQGYLEKDEKRNRVRLSRDGDASRGDPIRTAYRPLAVGEAFTLLEVELITGKPHQIRAHLASIGHPLIGDFKYGDKALNRMLQEKYGLTHQLLHSFRVEFPREDTKPPVGEALCGRSFTAPLPALFRRLINELNLEEGYGDMEFQRPQGICPGGYDQPHQ